MNHIPLVKSMKAEYSALRLAIQTQTRGRADAEAWAIKSLQLMKGIGKWQELSLKWQPVAMSLGAGSTSAVAVSPFRLGGAAVVPASQEKSTSTLLVLRKEGRSARSAPSSGGEDELIVVD